MVSMEHVWKRYRLGAGKRTHSRRLTADAEAKRAKRRGERFNDIWALADVSLQIQESESVGIIGPNGSGKSTTLKLISRVTEPWSGRVRARGRVGSLIEIRSGIHPELTGRENVFLYGTILGLSRKEIRKRFDEIVEFAEIGRFIDTPVKRYSSGMEVRLGFSVAVHLEPDILLIDEVLSVGDEAFQRKCLERMDVLLAQGQTIVFVSHVLPDVKRLCKRVVYLVRGGIRADGPADEVVNTYLQDVGEIRASGQLPPTPGTGS
jgi:lipopolysaccharide transport system ATP-binding protein